MAGSNVNSSAQQPVAAFQIATIRTGAKTGITAAPHPRTVLPTRQVPLVVPVKATVASVPVFDSGVNSQSVVASGGATPSARRFLKKLNTFAETSQRLQMSESNQPHYTYDDMARGYDVFMT